MTDMTLDDIIAKMGAIEPHLAALANEVDLPSLAIAQCALRVGEVAPVLRAIVAKAADGEPLSGDEKRLLLRGLFILAGHRDTETFPVFLRLLRRSEDELVDLFGDVPEVRLAPLLSGLFDGDVEALLGLARDRACAEDVRFAAIEATAFLTFDERIPRERMHAFLAGFVREPYAKDDDAWIAWADSIAKLGFRDLAPSVHAALSDGRIAKATLRKLQFDKDLAAAEADLGDAIPFEGAGYIADILEALEATGTGEMSDYGSSTAIATDAPIEVYLAALADRHLPDVALRICVERFAEAAPRLRSLLDRAAAGIRLSEDDSLRCFRGLHVLAAARDATSCASLLRLLRRPAGEVDDMLGDAVDVSLARILISLFDGDGEALLDLITNPTLDESLRGAVLEAATYMVWERRIERQALRGVLVEFHTKRPAADGAYIWYCWMMAVALLDFGDLVPLVEVAWKAHRIDHSILEWSDFKTDLARARTAWEDVDRFALSQVGYVDDVLAELEWTRAWANEDADRVPDAWDDPPEHGMPVVNPFKNVGRNDPCPCGSGKKYKKCCLDSA